MRRLSAFAVLLCSSSVFAKEPPPPTPPVLRAAEAQLVVVGEVAAVGKPMTVNVPAGNGQERAEVWTVAEVAVNTLLIGPDGKKTVQVGFQPRKPEQIEKDGYTLQLAAKEVRCLFLKRHPTEGFYVEVGVGPPLDPAKKEDQPALEQVKRVGAVLADPEKALKAAKADDRVFAALCLAYNYGPGERDDLKAEDVPKEESELILKALRDADPKKLERADGLFWVTAVEKFGLAKDNRLPGWWGERGKDRSEKRFQKYAVWYDKPGEKVRLQYWVPK